MTQTLLALRGQKQGLTVVRFARQHYLQVRHRLFIIVGFDQTRSQFQPVCDRWRALDAMAQLLHGWRPMKQPGEPAAAAAEILYLVQAEISPGAERLKKEDDPKPVLLNLPAVGVDQHPNSQCRLQQI